MNSPAGARAVVFDVGNVIVPWNPRAALEAGVSPQQAAAFLEADDFDFDDWNLQQDAGRSWADGLAWVREHRPVYAAAAQAYYDNFALSIGSAFPGTVRIIRQLADRGVPMVGLTNFAAELFPVARAKAPEIELFQDVVISSEVGLIKPDPRIFQVLAERMSAIALLAGSVYVDDLSANVEAAARAGLDAVVFTTPENLRADLQDRGLLDKES